MVLVEAQSRRGFGPAAIPSGSVPSFAGNAQHTAIYPPIVPNLNRIRWSATIDFNNSGDLGHYGAPLVTAANTLLAPVNIAGGAFRVDAFDGGTGAAKYSLTTDYILPSHKWIPVYNPCLATGSFGTRLYYAGAGGTIYHIDNPDSAAHGPPVQEVFYTTLANYLSNAAAYNASIFINTPLTADSSGNVFFGFRVQGNAPAPLSTTQSGFARVAPNGNATYTLVGTAANDSTMDRDSHNSAPALSNDEATLYVAAKSSSSAVSYLLGLDSTTLAPKYRVSLKDPRDGSAATVTDDSTASPTVAPDNDVYFGILGNNPGFRGFLLRFSSDLATQKTSGGFGWDYTPAIVPASMVPSYQGSSTYLLFCKYNNYAFGDGNGVNRVALLDPNSTQFDPHSSAPGFVEMREVLTLIGPTPDEDNYGPPPKFPFAVREWCINTAAVNPATNSIFVPNEDGRLYRWNVATNSFSQAVTLTAGIGEPYVPSLIGPDGTVYTLNGGTLFALGPASGVGLTLSSSSPDVRTFVTGQAVTFTATVTNPAAAGPTPTGTVTFEDFTYQDLTPVTTILASNVPIDANGRASVTTSTLAAGNGFLGSHVITATYSGDANFPAASAALVQKVHAFSTTTNVTSSPNPSFPGQTVLFTATVTGGSPAATGMVTFQEGSTALAQIPLSNGASSFNTAALSSGNHTVTAIYQSDTVSALSMGGTTHTVAGPTPTATATPTLTPSPSPSATATATATATPTATPTPTATATAAPAQAVNLSTRMRIETGDKAGIGGFIITGSAAKHVLIRAIGPSLKSSGIAEPLGDPFLDLYGSGASPIQSNNDWRDTQEASIKATGIPPLSNFESAIDATLPPGNYTAVVRGNDGGSGTALVEVYDLSQATGKLANISTRAFVSNGADITIAGFILGNQSGSANVVVRGLGPSLAKAGVATPLPNPSLELRDGEGALLATNNDWHDDLVQAAKVTAAGLAPADDREAAIAVTLPPGSYTALLSGQSETTGIGLVEVYNLGQ
ncbi:MAG TPA: Ig-like domain-containing protein [Chthoniobacterales bacterium]|nr:Ig-like domain-containing protein [Chthoniobacterales bacterium]